MTERWTDLFSQLNLNNKNKVLTEESFQSALFSDIELSFFKAKENISAKDSNDQLAETLRRTLNPTEKEKVLDSLYDYKNLVLGEAEDTSKVKSDEEVLSNQECNLEIVFVTDCCRGEKENELFMPEVQQLFFKMVKAMQVPDNLFTTISVVESKVNDEEILAKMMAENKDITINRLYHLKPRFVLCLGASVTNALLFDDMKKMLRLSEVHGLFYQKKLSADFITTIVPLFHPEYLMVNPSMKKTTWEDMQKVMKSLNRI